MAVSSLAMRNVRPDECDGVARLSVEAYREFAGALEPEDWATMRANLRNVKRRASEGSMLVAEQDGKLVGAVAYFAPGTPRHQRFPSDWALIIMLTGHPSHRRRGVGRLLTEECMRRAGQDGATQVSLHTSELVAAARSLYEELGFRQQRELRLYGLRYWTYLLELGT